MKKSEYFIKLLKIINKKFQIFTKKNKTDSIFSSLEDITKFDDKDLWDIEWKVDCGNQGISVIKKYSENHNFHEFKNFGDLVRTLDYELLLILIFGLIIFWTWEM